MLGAAHDGTSDAETSRRTRVDADSKAAMGVDTNGGRLPKTDFRIDLETPSAQCPAGQDRHRRSRERTRGRRVLRLVFSAETCAACPLRACCVVGKGGRSVIVSFHEKRIAAAGPPRPSPPRRPCCAGRSKVKRKFDHLQNLGMRQARYRGRRKIRLQAQLAATVAR